MSKRPVSRGSVSTSCATRTLGLALAANVHPKVVPERLGHSTIAMTLDTYSHAIPALQEDAAERVSRIVFGG
jgi:integrase